MPTATRHVPSLALGAAVLSTAAAAASGQCTPSTIFLQSNPSYAAGNGPNDIAAADLDGDGDIDLATANSLSDDVSVLFNNGDGTFAPPQTFVVGDAPVSLIAADFDGDGVTDLQDLLALLAEFGNACQ